MTTKSPLKSKTIWGIGIAALPTFLPLVGLGISEGDASMLGEQVDAIITAGGAILGIYGRVVAKTALGG